MNWEAIAAVAELLGALGVIASLVYLAGQVRSNASRARQAPTGGAMVQPPAPGRARAPGRRSEK